MTHDKYPTLHALGLGPALDEIERVCAIGSDGKYAGQAIHPDAWQHFDHALYHTSIVHSCDDTDSRDFESGERDLAHAAARLLMALAVSK